LSTESSVQLRELMAKMSNGEMTLDQALAEATDTTGQSLNTIGDVAGTVSLAMSDYLSETDTFFNDVTTDITTYNTSMSGQLDAYNTTNEGDIWSMVDVVTKAIELASIKADSTNTNDENGAKSLTEDEISLTTATLGINDALSKITASIGQATTALNAIEADKSAVVDSLVKKAVADINTTLYTMISTYFPKGTPGALAVSWSVPKFVF
jgi:hypothetical protein